MRAWKYYIVSIMSAVLIPVLPVSAADEPETGQDGFSAKEVVLGHFEDSYWWHIGTFGDREVALYLPVILHSKQRDGIASRPGISGTGRHMRDSVSLRKGNIRARQSRPSQTAAWSDLLMYP